MLKTRLRQIREHLAAAFGEMDETDLRWSYLVIAAMAVVGVAVNWFLPNGWTVWPMVLAIGILLLTHGASARNTDEVPPLHVYAMFGTTLTVWIGVTVLLRATNLLIVLGGLVVMLFLVARQILRQREKDRVVTARRAEGRCIHCGEPADPTSTFCPSCGEEPDPDSTRLKRVAGIAQSKKRTERLRAALTPEPPTASVGRKEKALLARRPRKR